LTEISDTDNRAGAQWESGEYSLVSLLEERAEEPKSKRLRYAVTAVALVLLLGFWLWRSMRYSSEEHTVDHFMDAVAAGNFQLAYQIWKPHQGTSYTFQDFLADWGDKGYYGPLKSYRRESAAEPRNGGSGVIVTIEISPYHPFPANSDPQSGRNREVKLWVERSDLSMSFPP
jgi:hypothetical protein